MPAAPLARADDVPVMAPGRYIELRRLAAGLSIEAVARLVFLNPVGADAAAEALRRAEAGCELLSDADLARLATVIRFVPGIYLGLVDGKPAIGICRSCGCSWHDACPGSCAWADGAETLCTSCLAPRS
jgi:hypothetical protein